MAADLERRSSVLVVDDNPDNLKSVEATLSGLGQRIVLARSGAEALRALLHEDFAVILLDVQMPTMDGFETATMIRKRPRSRYTPIIFLTAIHQTNDQVSRGYQLGAVDYIFKPIVAEILRAKVSVFIELDDLYHQMQKQAQQLRQIEGLEHALKISAMEERNKQLQEGSRLKSEFLANMSHELRTPLNAIIGFAQLLHDGEIDATSSRGKECLGYVLTSAHHLLELINGVLDLVKVESGKMEFHAEEVDVAMLVSEVIDIIGSLAAKRRIRVQHDIAPMVATVLADSVKLKQVLYNYLSNAIKFSPDGSSVMVRVVPEGAAHFRLQVEDNGIGIKECDMSRLFVEFEQLSQSANKTHGGTGLGLALTKRIVEAQGGWVAVESKWSSGSTFSAVLPNARELQPEKPPPPTAPPQDEEWNDELDGGLQGQKILIVDDNLANLTLARLLLQRAGYEVRSVSSAEEAQQLLDDGFMPRLMLLDLELPGKHGLDFSRTLKANPRYKGIAVMAYTASAMQGDCERAMEAGCDGYIAKPIDPHRLRAAVGRCLQEHPQIDKPGNNGSAASHAFHL